MLDERTHTCRTFLVLSICFAVSKSMVRKNAQTYIQSLPKAMDSFFFHFFNSLFSLFISFFVLQLFMDFFFLHFSTFPCFTTLFILHAVFFPVLHVYKYDVCLFVCKKNVTFSLSLLLFNRQANARIDLRVHGY